VTTIYIGVDPGVTGAFAVLDEKGGVEKVIGMPTVLARAGKGSRTDYDVPAIRDFFEGWQQVGQLFVTVEKTVPMPGTFARRRPPKGEWVEPTEPHDFVRSEDLRIPWCALCHKDKGDRLHEAEMSVGASIANYHRGGSYRGFLFMLITMRIPHQFEVPQAWQNVMLAGTAGKDTKVRSVLAAHSLFPGVTLRRNERSKGLDHNLSDALLICEFGRRMRTGALEVPGRKKAEPPLPLFR
jgi:hypothetical protein